MIAKGREIIYRDAAEAISPVKPHPEIRPLQSRKANITPLNDSTSLQSVQTSPKLGPKSNTTLSTKFPTNAILAHTETSPSFVDYKSVLTNFFHANSPDKVAEVDQFLQKYHVSVAIF